MSPYSQLFLEMFFQKFIKQDDVNFVRIFSYILLENVQDNSS